MLEAGGAPVLSAKQSWSTAVQLGGLIWRQILIFLKRMRHCSCKQICTWLWRFGLRQRYFSTSLCKGSEDPIPVKLTLKVDRTKIKQVNFLGYDLSNTGLYSLNRIFACLYWPAILQPKHFSPSRTFQLYPDTWVRQQEHRVRATCLSRGLWQLS